MDWTKIVVGGVILATFAFLMFRGYQEYRFHQAREAKRRIDQKRGCLLRFVSSEKLDGLIANWEKSHPDMDKETILDKLMKVIPGSSDTQSAVRLS